MEVEYGVGDEVVPVVITEYRRAYMTEPLYENSIDEKGNTIDDRLNYELVIPMREAVSCIGHKYGIKDDESEIAWEDLLIYLRDNVLPVDCTDAVKLKSFIKRAHQFIYHDNRLWKTSGKGKIPRLVVTDLARRQSLIAEAHNEAGHRGRDATYKHLWDRFYWPNLYDDVAFFIVSCIICQLRSARRPKTAFESTWNSAILRRFDLDTVYMPEGQGGMKFLLQAVEPAIAWPEARASRKNDSESWAKFIYQEIICRFGCIPSFKVDGGPEFKGAAEILLKQYGIVVVMTTPYTPRNNAVAERAHPTLCDSLFRACGTDASRWPLYLHACLLAMRCTTSRMTSFTPYFLLYGRSPLLAFDISDRTWDTLDWHIVRTTADLIALRAQQIVRRDQRLVQGLEQQR
jgi:hypothetical protein